MALKAIAVLEHLDAAIFGWVFPQSSAHVTQTTWQSCAAGKDFLLRSHCLPTSTAEPLSTCRSTRTHIYIYIVKTSYLISEHFQRRCFCADATRLRLTADRDNGCHSNKSWQQRTSYYITEGANYKRTLCSVVCVFFVVVFFYLGGTPATVHGAELQLRLFQCVSWCHIIHVEPFYSHESTKRTEFSGVSIGETCVRSVKATPINSCGGGGIPTARIHATLRLQLENGNRKRT